jgi:hypothetical protein
VSFRLCKATYVATVLALLVATGAAPPLCPASQGSSGDSASSPSKTVPVADKIKLIEATRVSTEEVARRAAQDKAKGTSKTVARMNSEKGASPGVSELQTVSKSADDSDATVRVSAAKGDKPLLKNIHGSVQGASGSRTRQGGAEVGVSSKTGKTHVYVETERSRSDPATPH